MAENDTLPLSIPKTDVFIDNGHRQLRIRDLLFFLHVASPGINEAKYFVISHIACRYTCTRDVFYVRRKVDLMKTAKVNAYILHIFGKV